MRVPEWVQELCAPGRVSACSAAAEAALAVAAELLLSERSTCLSHT